jgi:hypothetical protein
MIDFKKKLVNLKQTKIVKVFDNDIPDEAGSTSIVIDFVEGAWLRVDYWRFIKDDQ